MKRSTSILATAALFLSAVHAQKNDWSKPCLDGVCFYDHPRDPGGRNIGSSGFIKVWGSPSAITDITEAAGWLILDCDPKKMQQDIRLVCKSKNPADAGCSHLFKDSAPEGKLVRLPEACGKMPFARIAKAWIPNDQSIPADVSAQLVRRDGQPPQVHALSIDTKFAAADAKAKGPVNIQVLGSNVPGKEGAAKPTSRSLTRRNFIDDAFGQFTKFDTNVKKSLPPFSLQQNFPIIHESLSCPASGNIPSFQIGVDASVDYSAHAQIAIGVAATGTVIPPKLDNLALYANLDADLSGNLHIKAQASGGLDTGTKTLFEKGIPGLDFPGILTVGPSFKLNANAKAAVGLDLDTTVNLAYSVKNAEMFWPPSQRKSGAQAAPADSTFTLSVNPNIQANGRIEAHLIPTIDFGLNALGGAASATVFIDLDASASMDLSVQASATASIPIAVPTKGNTGPAPKVAASAQVNGCVDIQSGINIQAGANAAFFNLFNAGATQSLFSKTFDLFKKCGGTATAKTRALPRAILYRQLGQSSTIERRALVCPSIQPNFNLLFNQPLKGSKP